MARGRDQGGFFDIFAVFKIITKNQPLRLISNPRHSKICRHCDKALQTNQEEHGFCSHPCAADKWEIFRLGSRTNICKMPGCTQPCYTDKTGKPYDFCGKTHADSYKTMMEEFEKEKMRKKRITHCSHSDSSHGSGIIRFYNRDDPFYEFTNFYHAPIVLDGKLWPTTEHYFQAQKFVGTPFSEVIRKFQNPREAFDCARRPTVSCWQRNDWKEVKVDIMRKALLAKFTQHERLRKLLLKTGDNVLIEHSPYDSFWGNGKDGRGDNKLGVLLMEIRHDFKKTGSDSSAAKAAISSRGSYSGSSSYDSKPSSSSSSHLVVTWEKSSEGIQRETDDSGSNKRVYSLTRSPLYSNPPKHTEGSRNALEANYVPVTDDLIVFSTNSTKLLIPIQETQNPSCSSDPYYFS